MYVWYSSTPWYSIARPVWKHWYSECVLLPVDVQHSQCPRWFFILYREIRSKARWSQNYGAERVHNAMPCTSCWVFIRPARGVRVLNKNGFRIYDGLNNKDVRGRGTGSIYHHSSGAVPGNGTRWASLCFRYRFDLRTPAPAPHVTPAVAAPCIQLVCTTSL